MCATTLLSFHQLYIICQSNNTRFLQSLEGEAYEHHMVKNQVGGDASELLELQSSFSREIENEIFNMHGSKEINEAESEIAANAAVKELERIGSAENISLVEEVTIDVIQSITNDVHPNEVEETKKSIDVLDTSTPNTATTTQMKTKQTESETEEKKRNKTKKEPIRKQAKTDEKLTKSKANAKSTVTTANAIKSRNAKTPKKIVKSPKTEILKENITRSKSKSAERAAVTVPTNGTDVKENSCIDDDNDDTQM